MPFTMERLSRLGEEDRDFDLEYWSQFTPEERWEAGWELVVLYYSTKGQDATTFRLDRSVEGFRRLES